MDRCGKCLLKSSMLAAGLLFGSIIVFLLYYTYEYLAGYESYYTLWIDIPGRLVLVFLCYYMSGLLGCLPLPISCRLSKFPEPFLLWKFWTWRNQCREMRATYEDLDTAPTNEYISQLYYPPYQSIDAVRNLIPTVPHSARPDYPSHGNVSEESSILNHPPIPAAESNAGCTPAVEKNTEWQVQSCTSFGKDAENFVFPNFYDGPRPDRLEAERIKEEKKNKRKEQRRPRHGHPRHPWAILRAYDCTYVDIKKTMGGKTIECEP